MQAAGIAVAMGCGDACPICAGQRYLDWDLLVRAVDLGRDIYRRISTDIKMQLFTRRARR